MCFMEGHGVDGHVGDFFLYCFKFEMVLTQCGSRAVL